MSIRDDFLNIDKEFLVSGNSTEDLQLQYALKTKINDIKQILKEQSTSKVELDKNELDMICKIYSIDSGQEEDRNLIKEIISKTNFNTQFNYPVVFMYNLLVINNEIVNNYLKGNKHEDVVLRELTQLLTIIKLNKKQELKEIATIGSLPFDSNEQFNEILSLEENITKKIKNTISFEDLISFLSALDSDIEFSEEGKKLYGQVVYEVEQIVLGSPLTDNLVEFKNKKLCFNQHSLNQYLQAPLNNDRKRELIQSLVLIVNQEKQINNYSHTIFEQKNKIIDFLERKVTQEEIDNAIDKLPKEQGKISSQVVQNINSLLKVNEVNKFLIFENISINENNMDKLMTFDFKEDQIIIYFLIQCVNENENIECKLFNNKIIKFKDFNEVFYMEDLLKKQLTQYSLNEILQTVHEFKKDKIFSKEDQKIIDSVISENFIQKFSFNTANKEIIFINESRCVFNEKLISKLNDNQDNQILEMYLLTNQQLLENLSENIVIDKRIDNLKLYKDKLIDRLKYRITEKDIMDSIETIEKKSNTLIQSKDDVFQNATISLNAKEVPEISNDIVEFSYRNEELYLYSFNNKICEKLLKKELIDLSKREFVQALYLYEIKNKEITLKNKENHAIKVHDNFKEMLAYNDLVLQKLEYNINEEEIEKAINIINVKLNESQIQDLQYISNNIKKKCGLKIKSTFKHIL